MRKLAVAMIVAGFLTPGVAHAFPTWDHYHARHAIHVKMAVRKGVHPWENATTRATWSKTRKLRTARMYHTFMDKRQSYLASLVAPSTSTNSFVSSGPYTGDHLALLLCIHSYEGAWDANTGNGFWGGLQFYPSTWFGWGGGPFDGVGPFPYSEDYQLNIAEGAGDAAGWSTAWLHGQWPLSSVYCGV